MSAPSTTTASSRWASLDVVRGIAILLVLIQHAEIPRPGPSAPVWWHLHQFLQNGGWIGVDLFFVLSGFLVAGILFRQYTRTGEIHLSEFLFRRGCKIYPQFWIMLALSVLLGKSSGRVAEIGPQHVVSELLFIQNYSQGVWSHTWSLGVEEHCYLALGLLLWGWTRTASGKRTGLRLVPWFLLAGIIAAPLLRCLMVQLDPAVTFRKHLMPTHARFDNFFLGALIAWWATTASEQFLSRCHRLRWGSVILGTVLLLPNFVFPLDLTYAPASLGRNQLIVTGGLSVNALGAACWLLAACGFPASTSRRPLLAWIGEHSYGIYLWHTLIFIKLILPPLRGYFMSSPSHIIQWLLIYFPGTILVGACSTWLIERPILRLRDRWCPSSAGALSANALTTAGQRSMTDEVDSDSPLQATSELGSRSVSLT